MNGRVTALLLAAVLALAEVAHAGGPLPGVLMTKTLGLGSPGCGTAKSLAVDPGTTVTYCWTAGNVGAATLITHSLDDSEFGSLLNNFVLPLAPGQELPVTRIINACASATNFATWNSLASDGLGQSTDNATLTVNPLNPAIVLTKTVSTGGCPGVDQITVAPGTNVTYCYAAGNTGNVTLMTHILIDSELGPIVIPPTPLAPGQETSVSQMQVINMSTTNVATWTSAFTIECGSLPFKVGGAFGIPSSQITGTATDTDSAQVLVITATPTPTSTNTPTSTSTSTQTGTPTHTPTPTSSPTQTGTPTNTPSPQENGDPCTTPIQCESMNCVDGVCCDTPCDQPDEICNLPGQEGTCTEFSLAPALGNLGLAAAAALLMGIGGLSLTLRRRRE